MANYHSSFQGWRKHAWKRCRRGENTEHYVKNGVDHLQRLAVDPNKNNIIFFGTREQGLWKSSDYGATWAKVPSFTWTGMFVVLDYDCFLTHILQAHISRTLQVNTLPPSKVSHGLPLTQPLLPRALLLLEFLSVRQPNLLKLQALY